MRVGFYLFFPGGGIGRYTHELVHTLDASGEVDVELLCTPDFEWHGERDYALWDHLLPVWDDHPLVSRLRFLRGQILNPLLAARHAGEADLDVLHLSNINHLTFPLWRPALERSGARLAVTAHDVRRAKSMISRRWEDRQLRAVYRRADVVFVHSDYQRRELVAFAGVPEERVVIVPHGPYPYGEATNEREVLRRRWGLPLDRQVALFFGQIRDEKNLDGLLHAWAALDEPPHLFVAGKTSSAKHREVAHYEALIRRLNLNRHVTFRNEFVPDEDVPDVFRAADWVVLPYRRSFTSQSGVLNVAAAQRRPVLASAAPVLAETVRHARVGLVCDGDDPSALAEGVVRMMAHVESGEACDFDGYQRLYSWQENARRTLAAYRAVLGHETDVAAAVPLR